MIREMKLDGRTRRGRMTREIGYQKVLLAVHVLSNDDGLACQESNARIARECGVSVPIVMRSLAEMRRRGVIEVFDNRDGLSSRVVILLDHPSARGLIDDIRLAYGNRIRLREIPA